MGKIGPAPSKRLEYDRWYRHTERGREVKRLSGIRARIKHRTRRIAQDKITRMRRVYGLTPEMYQTKLREQEWMCPICLRPQEAFNRRFTVDHDHATGLTRELLCTRCNGIVLRVVEEEWSAVIRALKYLRKWRTRGKETPES